MSLFSIVCLIYIDRTGIVAELQYLLHGIGELVSD